MNKKTKSLVYFDHQNVIHLWTYCVFTFVLRPLTKKTTKQVISLI